MTPPHSSPVSFAQWVRCVIFLTAFGAGAVHADDYTDITSLLKSGKPAEALSRADQRLATAPRDPQLRFLRGVAQADSGKTSDAIASFTQLTEEYPELPEPYNNLAVLYAGQNQLDKSRTALEMAIGTNPSYATAHENLGDIYAKLAGQAYNKALQLDANNGAALKPKLAMIRDLFAATPGTGRPVQIASTTAAVVAAPKPPVAAVAAVPSPAVAAVPAKPAPAKEPAASAPATTPPAASSSVVPAVKAPILKEDKAGADQTAKREVEAAVAQWASAWSDRDMKNYLAAYGSKFAPPGKQTRAAWEKERELRIVPRSRIKVALSELSSNINGDKAIVKFRQAYDADSLSVTSRKTLELVRERGRWVIVRESTGG